MFINQLAEWGIYTLHNKIEKMTTKSFYLVKKTTDLLKIFKMTLNKKNNIKKQN